MEQLTTEQQIAINKIDVSKLKVRERIILGAMAVDGLVVIGLLYVHQDIPAAVTGMCGALMSVFLGNTIFQRVYKDIKIKELEDEAIRKSARSLCRASVGE